MNIYRFLLFPISFIYLIITSTRNLFYDLGVFKSYVIPGKSIVVGNLSMGGTGKTPFVDYLIASMLNNGFEVDVLSRGYGRKTKGLREVFETDTPDLVGDEPLFYKQKYKDRIRVIVAEKRKQGVLSLRKKKINSIIILDDAFQHRAVKAGFYFLISEYKKPFFKDIIIPVGRLRESRFGAKRSDCVIFSKSPKEIKESKIQFYTNKSKIYSPVKPLFSSIRYNEIKSLSNYSNNTFKNVLLVTGIGNPLPLINELSTKYNVSHLKFPDHYQFKDSDISKIHKKFDTFASTDKVIITTEKDLVRLYNLDSFQKSDKPWFVQPISVLFRDENKLNSVIKSYVESN